jgi:hypothetical protein
MRMLKVLWTRVRGVCSSSSIPIVVAPVEVNLKDGRSESNLAAFAKVISILKPISTCMEPSTFDVAERRKRINVFKVGKL